MKNVGGLLHLHHERRVSARDVVGGSDPREDAIDERNLGFARRHERADLRHDRQERRLAQVGGLAAHVRAGEDDELARGAVERDVVGNKRLAGRRRASLDHRMSRVHDCHLVAVVHVRLDVVVDGCALSKSRQHVQGRERAGGRLDSRRFAGNRRPERLEDLQLALEDALVGAQDLFFVFLQRGSDEALAPAIVCLR